jgi:hypothetical protein
MKEIPDYIKEQVIPTNVYDRLDGMLSGQVSKDDVHSACHDLLAEIVDSGPCHVATQIEGWIITCARLYAAIEDKSRIDSITSTKPQEAINPAVKSATVDARIEQILSVIGMSETIDRKGVMRALMTFIATDGPDKFLQTMSETLLYAARLRSDLAAARKGDHFAV